MTQFFNLTAAEIAGLLGSPPANVQQNWPGVYAACAEAGLTDCPTVIAVVATIGTEVGSFAPINEFGGTTYFTKLYEGRKELGNTRSGDGARYHGRGFIQLTGRANYAKYGQALGIPLEDDPDLALTRRCRSGILALYFKDRGLPALARKGDWKGVRRGVNGHLNGWERFSGLVQALEKAAAARGDTLDGGRDQPGRGPAQGAAHDLGAQPRAAAAAREHAELRACDDRGGQGLPEGERGPADR